MPRRKALKTGSRTRGRGHKKGRGAGLRGGRGNAGFQSFTPGHIASSLVTH